jgi:hypothetical protein
MTYDCQRALKMALGQPRGPSWETGTPLHSPNQVNIVRHDELEVSDRRHGQSDGRNQIVEGRAVPRPSSCRVGALARPSGAKLRSDCGLTIPEGGAPLGGAGLFSPALTRFCPTRLHRTLKNSDWRRLWEGHDFTGCGKTPSSAGFWQGHDSGRARLQSCR